MMDIHRLASMHHIGISKGKVPKNASAQYRKKSKTRPAMFFLSDQIDFSRVEQRELLAMAYVWHCYGAGAAKDRKRLFYLDRDPTPEHLWLRQLAAQKLIEIEILSQHLHDQVFEMIELAKIFDCRLSLMECRLSVEDIATLWDPVAQEYHQLNLHKAAAL